MSARSSALEVAAVVVAVAACSKAAKLPEEDPAKVTALAKAMIDNVPTPGAWKACKFEELIGGATLTRRTMLELAKQPIDPKSNELQEYVNPPELDSPAARVLIDNTDQTELRQAAAELLAAPFYLVYHIDLVDVPIPIGVKDFKRGYVGARALRYDKTGRLACAMTFVWTNSPAKQKWAVEISDKPLIDPAVAKEMQQDLRAQMLVRIQNLAKPADYDPKLGVDDRADR
jgi:hypothetical protein